MNLKEFVVRNLMIINDLHAGAVRSGGTTPASALRLRKDLLFGAQQLFDLADDCDLLINGDLFDTFSVPLEDMFTLLQIASGWLRKNTGCSLFVNLGNHDLAKMRNAFSSFDFFTQALALEFPTRAIAIRGLTQLPGRSFWVLSHVANQDEFELELSRVPACDYLAIHANYDNGFATKSDHSLNLSEGQAQALIRRGVKAIVLGHEHQAKQTSWRWPDSEGGGGGTLIVVGNQMPSSVADCLGNNVKCALRIDSAGVEWIPTWEADGSFVELEWSELAECANTTCDFVRVIGKAQPDEASAVVQAIAKFRQRSNALVVTNAVQIAGVSTDDIEVSLEQIQNFNVMAELLAWLDEEQRAVVTKLLAEVENV